MMPEMLQGMVTSVTESIGCRLTPAKASTINTTVSNTTFESVEEMEVKAMTRLFCCSKTKDFESRSMLPVESTVQGGLKYQTQNTEHHIK